MRAVECANSQEAVDLLHHCLEQGDILEGRHFREELRKEGLVIEDAYVVLRSGFIYEPPEIDIKTGEWKWRIEGPELDGRWLMIVFSFKTVDRAFLITVYSIEAKRRAPRR